VPQESTDTTEHASGEDLEPCLYPELNSDGLGEEEHAHGSVSGLLMWDDFRIMSDLSNRSRAEHQVDGASFITPSIPSSAVARSTVDLRSQDPSSMTSSSQQETQAGKRRAQGAAGSWRESPSVGRFGRLTVHGESSVLDSSDSMEMTRTLPSVVDAGHTQVIGGREQSVSNCPTPSSSVGRLDPAMLREGANQQDSSDSVGMAEVFQPAAADAGRARAKRGDEQRKKINRTRVRSSAGKLGHAKIHGRSSLQTSQDLVQMTEALSSITEAGPSNNIIPVKSHVCSFCCKSFGRGTDLK
jgi:hypothetical protein